MKRILILLLCGVMCLPCVLTGCQSNVVPAESDTAVQETTAGETETAEPAATEEETTRETVTTQEQEIETEKMPDSVNHENFTDCTLDVGQTYRHNTVYKFSVK